MSDRTRQAIWAGVGTIIVSLVLVLLPLALGSSSINKYFVAFGFIGLCLGAGFFVNGVWDWLRPR